MTRFGSPHSSVYHFAVKIYGCGETGPNATDQEVARRGRHIDGLGGIQPKIDRVREDRAQVLPSTKSWLADELPSK
jgi:hypothetical protein